MDGSVSLYLDLVFIYFYYSARTLWVWGVLYHVIDRFYGAITDITYEIIVHDKIISLCS